jgi:vacuolar-type H+-ATPase subunit E/Vma4
MAIENIIKKIERDNREKVEGITGEAESKAEEIRADYRKQGEELKEELDEKFRRKADEHRRQIIVSEQLELRKKMLGVKREILEEFYEQARNKIEELSGEEYAAFIKKLILSRAVTGREEILIPEGHKEIFDDAFIDSLNGEFGEGSFRVSPAEGDFSWGFRLREKDRLVDLSLDSFFREVIEDLEPEVAAILFAKGNG